MIRRRNHGVRLIGLFCVLCAGTASAAVETSKSTFWENLEKGVEQKLVVYGTSLSIQGDVAWPNTLKRALEDQTGTTVNLVKNGMDGAYSKHGKQNLQSKVIDPNPDVVVMEFASNDAVNRFNCTIGGCAEPNHRYMIETLRNKLPSCEILLYVTARPWDASSCGSTPCKVCGVRNAHYCRRSAQASSDDPVEKYFEMVRKLAAEYETYLADTYWDTKEIWDTNRSSYGQYIYDGHHTTQRCADEIIIPRMIEALKGTANGASPEASITIEEPTEGASYRVGEVMIIRWAYNPDSITRTLNINISPDNGVSYLTVDNESIPPQHKEFRWTIPEDIGGISLTSNEVFLQIQEYNTHREAFAGPFSITGSDKVPPNVKSVFARSATSVNVVFDEPVTKESAERIANYSISRGIDVVGASLRQDTSSVLLTTSPLSEETGYVLTVSGITDRSPNSNTGGGEHEFTLSGEIRISNLTAASGKSYEIVENVAVGHRQFIDRDYTFGSLGECAGMTYIRTANNDGNASDESFLSFDISGAATIYVAYRHGTDLPPWLSSWSKTGDEVCGDGCSDVYQKDFAAGTVTLGGNKPGGAGNMYSVFVDGTVAGNLLRPNGDRSGAHWGRVTVRLAKNTLKVSGLPPHQVCAITLTDAHGRAWTVSRKPGACGALRLPTANRSPGVYFVDLRWGNRRNGFTLVLP